MNEPNNWVNRLLARTGSQYRLVTFQHLAQARYDGMALAEATRQYERQQLLEQINAANARAEAAEQREADLQERAVELKRRLACAISSAHYYRKKSSKKPAETET